ALIGQPPQTTRSGGGTGIQSELYSYIEGHSINRSQTLPDQQDTVTRAVHHGGGDIASWSAIDHYVNLVPEILIHLIGVSCVLPDGVFILYRCCDQRIAEPSHQALGDRVARHPDSDGFPG